ncbi:hypothetical protein [Jiangella muralis]|uniref:hypothetical protein n=1 Tax=Jiangella muralis TaxID=702383 RepID=UPI00069F6620|nr:hypothetical protein [Jiangella muralis]
MGATDIYENFAKLAAWVKESGGMLTIQMGALRNYVEAGRLDVGPRRQIKENLDRHGLMATTELKREQEDWVLIIEKNGPVHTIMSAINHPWQNSDERIENAALQIAPVKEELAELREIVSQVWALTKGYYEEDDE